MLEAIWGVVQMARQEAVQVSSAPSMAGCSALTLKHPLNTLILTHPPDILVLIHPLDALILNPPF